MDSGFRVVQDEKGEIWLLKKKHSDLAKVDRVSGREPWSTPGTCGEKATSSDLNSQKPPPNVDRLSRTRTALNS